MGPKHPTLEYPPRSSQETLLCSVRVLAAVSNHAEAIRGRVHACTRELVNACSRDFVKGWRLLEPKRARSARVNLVYIYIYDTGEKPNQNHCWGYKDLGL